MGRVASIKITRSRFCIAILVMLFAAAIVNIICGQNTFAQNAITKTYINGNSGIDDDGGTTFYVSFDYGDACWDCEIEGSFRCTKSGAGYTTTELVDNSKTTVTYKGAWDGYWHFWVDIYPSNSSYQSIGGYIRQPITYTFSASTTKGSISYDMDAGTATANFNNTVRRTDSIDGDATSDYYRRLAHRIKRRGSDSWTNKWFSNIPGHYGSVTLAKGGSKQTGNISDTVSGLNPGDTVQICEQLNNYAYSVSVADIKRTDTAWNWNANPPVACLQTTLPFYTLNVEGKNIYNGNNLNAGDIKPAATGYGNKTVTRKSLSSADTPYRFVCWKTSTSTGTSGCITNTSSSSDPHVSDLTSGSYLKYHKNLTADHTVYAYYARKYKLTIDTDYASVTVTRKSSPYANAGTGALTNGSAIYPGDVLTIKCSKNACSNWTERKANTTNLTSCDGTNGQDYTVTGDTTISIKAALREYSLSKSAATGSTITVNRSESIYGKNASSYTGGIPTTKGNRITSNVSSGNLNSGAALYCGDKITDKSELSTGYSWGNYGWSNNTHEWGYHFQSNNSGGNGDRWNVTGPSDPANHSSYTSSTYTVDDNVTAETQAVRDEFKGRARVDSGSSVSIHTRETTDYVNTAKTAEKTIECANEADGGCPTILDLYAKTTQGTGPMKYYLGTSKNWVSNGNTSWVPTLSLSAASTNPSASGTLIDETKITLLPGQSICKYLKFTPLGTSSDKVNVGACMHTIESLFQGNVSVSGSVSGSSGWSNTSTEKVFYANNCTNGCTVSFKHELKRTQGIGSTDYTAVRKSNLTDTARGIADGDVKSGTFRPSTDTSQNNNAKTVATDPTSGTYTLYPGMKVCEKLTFKPSNNVVNVKNAITITTCALALGDSQPGDPTDPNDPGNPSNDPNGNGESGAFIDIEVKNDNVTRYGTYRRIIYAKPNDVITYRASYNPTLQYTYHIKPQRMQISDSSTTYSNALSNKLGVLFNATGKTWKNFFSAQKGFQPRDKELNAVAWSLCANYISGGSTSSKNENCNSGNLKTNLKAGSMDKVNPAPTNQITINMTHVGQSLNEKALTNLNTDTKTTPSQVTFTCTANNSNVCTGYNKAYVDIAQKDQIAYARIPYNFNINTEITTSETKPNSTTPTPVYTGEQMDIGYDISVDNKRNCETANNCDEYSTKADKVRHEIVVYNPDTVGLKNGGIMAGGRNADVCSTYFRHSNDEINCGYSGDKTEDLSSGKNSRSASFYAQDWEAGKKVCVAIAVFPASSGADTNWNDMNYSNSWRISDSKCYTIAKRPSLQIWGGNFYSTGNVITSISKKNNIKDYTGYSVSTKNGDTYVFGSWGELGVISAGVVDGLASGAGTGFAMNSGNALWPSYNSSNSGNNLLGAYGPGGDKEANISICLRNRLTLANYPCNNNNSTVKLGGTNIKTNGSRDKSAIIQNFMRGINADNTYNTGNNLTLTVGSAPGYYKNDGNFTLASANVQSGIYAIESTGGNITIANNLTYAGSYTKMSEIPKIVIHAKNININCNVTRIDAVLIADNTVTTCANGSTGDNYISKPEYSTPLKVNGTIIANKLVPNRTYGAAAGANSIIPAEIINYDSTLYVWGSHESDSTESGKLTVTYTRELAPRF